MTPSCTHHACKKTSWHHLVPPNLGQLLHLRVTSAKVYLNHQQTHPLSLGIQCTCNREKDTSGAYIQNLSTVRREGRSVETIYERKNKPALNQSADGLQRERLQVQPSR